MIKILKSLFFSLFKKWYKKKKEEEELDAYLTVGIKKDGNISLTGKFDATKPDILIHLLFTYFSGTLNAHIIEILKQKYDDDTVEEIMKRVYFMITEFMQENGDDEDDEPVVDPCDVFRPRDGIEDEVD